MTAKPVDDRLGLLGSGDMVNDLAAAQQEEGRDTGNTEASPEIGALLGIDLNHGRFAGQHQRYLSHRRCE